MEIICKVHKNFEIQTISTWGDGMRELVDILDVSSLKMIELCLSMGFFCLCTLEIHIASDFEGTCFLFGGRIWTILWIN